MIERALLKSVLFGLTHIIRHTAKKSPVFEREMRKHDCTVQIRLQDRSIGRYYTFKSGTVRTASGFCDKPDVVMMFKDLATALTFFKPPIDMGEVVHAAKQFRLVVFGRDELAVWFMQLLNQTQTATLQYGTPMPDGTVRYTTNTNGGPVFVYVKDGRIVRTGLIELDGSDAASWSIHARGKEFKPWRKAMVSPYTVALKTQVYSDRRVLYPMKRVDFDPNGERNTQNRGKSGYVRISWDEALDLVANEIKRQRRVHGPGSMAIQHPSHHQWGNVGYYLSALLRFGNLLGFTRIHPNPDSWEGWYWGAQHHYGNSMRVGIASHYGTVEDCFKDCELMVFWSSDPETTSGGYAGFEATQRRMWAKELGIEFVHIDPNLNPTAQLLGGKWIPVRPGTDPALAAAIMHVWVVEKLYDEEYVTRRTTGFEAWRDYLLGKDDGVPKTPEWQEAETGVPAATVRALARTWARKKTYLAAGGTGTGLGGACRNGTGTQWPRAMIYMMAMQGWGKPGINMGNLQLGTPLETAFYFPEYAEGGISGELAFTASAVNNYARMPHILTMNPVKQVIPRQSFPEAIIEGRATGYFWDGSSLESQFAPFHYPMPGYSRVHMLYRYGASAMGTICDSSRFVEAYRHPSLEFIVCQGIYMESEMQMADVILPACTSLERWDISEWAACGGYVHHAQLGLNHRIILLQHKCIEPLGESKSDYQIFLEILHRFDKGALFSEGCGELDWCKRQFDSSDLPKHISWKEFVRKGYYVVPAPAPEVRPAVSMRWYAEDRPKDVPEPHPLPAGYGAEMGKGLPTQSGKIEFVSSSILLGDPDNPERPALNRYRPAVEGLTNSERSTRFPLLMTSTHSRYSFHTYTDGKDTTINDIEDHRVLVDGHYYWVMRMHPKDARQRGIKHHDLIRVYNDRGAVICAADVSPLMVPGVVKTYEASAEYVPARDDKGFVDLGGCVNQLTPKRPQTQHTSGMSASTCLVEIELWTGAASVVRERLRA